ncbi:hypothetical protein CEE44_03040 [Candidatus Woesearchaeota archaeon B3_Woes]|nr:MAG: hypothetical protein CEE44_03040 [Candidatus Woesearchaeota archaeon B3_Woes]
MTEKILCRSIVEVVGKPKEHVEKALNLVIEKAQEIKGLKIEKKEISEIKSLKDEKLSKTEHKIQQSTGELFTSFVEIEFMANNLDVVASFCFDFLPSSIEIVEPEKMKINTHDVSNLMNDLLSKLHNADMAVKRLNFENAALTNNAKLLLRNMIMVSLKLKEQKLEDLSSSIGIPVDQLKPFLEALVNENFVKEEEGLYKLNKDG